MDVGAGDDGLGAEREAAALDHVETGAESDGPVNDDVVAIDAGVQGDGLARRHLRLAVDVAADGI